MRLGERYTKPLATEIVLLGKLGGNEVLELVSPKFHKIKID
jgi:hypothetical protein